MKNQKYLNLANTEMTQLLKLSNKSFKAARLKVLHKEGRTLTKQMEK